MFKILSLACAALLLSACSSMSGGMSSANQPTQLGTTATMGSSSGSMRNGDGPN
jgi:uncharacterized lipoprotein YajG